MTNRGLGLPGDGGAEMRRASNLPHYALLNILLALAAGAWLLPRRSAGPPSPACRGRLERAGQLTASLASPWGAA